MRRSGRAVPSRAATPASARACGEPGGGSRAAGRDGRDSVAGGIFGGVGRSCRRLSAMAPHRASAGSLPPASTPPASSRKTSPPALLSLAASPASGPDCRRPAPPTRPPRQETRTDERHPAGPAGRPLRRPASPLPAIGMAHWFTGRACRSPERPALSFEGETELRPPAGRDRTARQCARRWRGVRPGMRVGYLGFNHPAFLLALFASAAGRRLRAAQLPPDRRRAGLYRQRRRHPHPAGRRRAPRDDRPGARRCAAPATCAWRAKPPTRRAGRRWRPRWTPPRPGHRRRCRWPATTWPVIVTPPAPPAGPGRDADPWQLLVEPRRRVVHGGRAGRRRAAGVRAAVPISAASTCC